jgi:ribose 5-phosphate isomerase B
LATPIDRSRVRELVQQVLGDLQAAGATPPDPTAASSAVPAVALPDVPPAHATAQPAAAQPAPQTHSAAQPAAAQPAPQAHFTPAPAPALAPPRPGADRRIALGSDHGGYLLKESLKELLQELHYEVYDVGTHSTAACDYPDFAIKVGRALQEGRCRLGIMIDGAGIGSAMALNKLAGIRAATVHSEATARNSREHNDANVLVLGAGQIHAGHARRVTRIWLATEHAGGRHAKRVDKINALDGQGAPPARGTASAAAAAPGTAPAPASGTPPAPAAALARNR